MQKKELRAALEQLMEDPLRRDSWRQVYRATFASVLAFATFLDSRLGYSHKTLLQPEDVAQETFLRFFMNFDFRTLRKNGDIAAAVLSYMRRVARNLVLDAARRAERSPVSTDPALLGEIGTAAAAASSASQRGLLPDLLAAISELRPRQRRIAELLLEGEDAKAIAKRLGMARNHVYVEVHRLRKKLAKLLELPDATS